MTLFVAWTWRLEKSTRISRGDFPLCLTSSVTESSIIVTSISWELPRKFFTFIRFLMTMNQCFTWAELSPVSVCNLSTNSESWSPRGAKRKALFKDWCWFEVISVILSADCDALHHCIIASLHHCILILICDDNENESLSTYVDTRPNIYCFVMVNENKQVIKKATLSPICFDK